MIFVDPKYIGDAGQRQDLIDQMLAAAPAEHWVPQGLLRQRLADNCGTHRRNRDGTGYHYGRDLAASDLTAQNWDMPAFDLAATAEQWAMVKAGRPVIAFFITGEETLAEAMTKGC